MTEQVVVEYGAKKPSFFDQAWQKQGSEGAVPEAETPTLPSAFTILIEVHGHASSSRR